VSLRLLLIASQTHFTGFYYNISPFSRSSVLSTEHSDIRHLFFITLLIVFIHTFIYFMAAIDSDSA